MNKVKLVKHIDGDWYTTEYNYLDFKIVIKSREGKGMKAHCFHNGKVIFTERWKFIYPSQLLKRVKNKIDYYSLPENKEKFISISSD